MAQRGWALAQLEPGVALDPVLLALWAPDDEDRTAMRRHGIIESVAVLRARAAGQSRQVTDVAESATVRIQARYAGAEAGQVSLAPGPAGAVSLAEAPVEDEPGSA